MLFMGNQVHAVGLSSSDVLKTATRPAGIICRVVNTSVMNVLTTTTEGEG